MPNLTSATHYPGTVIFEATNLSVGRGTAVPFQVLGAPWLDPTAVRAAVGALPGVELSDTVVVPRAPPDGKLADLTLPAVRLTATDRSVYDPVRTAVALLAAIHQTHPDSLDVREERLARLLGSAEVWRTIAEGGATADVTADWEAGVRRFRARWDGFRLYR